MAGGCRSCGSGGGIGGSIQIQKAIGNGGGGAAPASDPDMVLMEYIGIPTQFQTVRSRANRSVLYRYGGDQGNTGRLFYVYKADFPWMSSLTEFRAAEVRPVATMTQQTADLPVLSVEMTSSPAAVTGEPVTSLLLDGEIISILTKAGYESVEAVRAASRAELASIKGMGPARIKKVENALTTIS